MKAQKYRIVEHIIERIPKEYIKGVSKMNQRKLIKFIIDENNQFIFDSLVNGSKFIITNIGRLCPVKFKIGAKINPFTGKPVLARESKRIKFTPSIKLRNKLREE